MKQEDGPVEVSFIERPAVEVAFMRSGPGPHGWTRVSVKLSTLLMGEKSRFEELGTGPSSVVLHVQTYQWGHGTTISSKSLENTADLEKHLNPLFGDSWKPAWLHSVRALRALQASFEN